MGREEGIEQDLIEFNKDGVVEQLKSLFLKVKPISY